MESVFKFWQKVDGKIRGMIPVQVFLAVVSEVDETARTCKVKVNDNVEYEDVRLYAVVDDSLKGFCLVPVVDSMVLVGRIGNGNELYVVSFSEVDKVLGSIGDKTEIAIDEESLSYKCDKTEIAIDKDSLSCKVDKTDVSVKSNDVQVKIDGVTFAVADKKVTIDADEIDLNGTANSGVPKVKAVKDNLDAIKNYLTAMDAAIAAGLNGIGAGPTAAGSAGAGAYQGAMTGQSIVFQDMENSKVKH